jgi:integrase/recombinase XerD
MTPLRRRMTEDMQVRSFSPRTQATYVQQVSLFARHFNRSPKLLGPEDIRSYQVYLTNQRKLAPSSISIAISALRFLYKITLHKDWCLDDVIPTTKTPQKLPIVLSPEEVLQFLGCVRNIKHRTILTLCYAAGLRVSEAICLKVTDIESAHGHPDRTGQRADGSLCYAFPEAAANLARLVASEKTQGMALPR